MRHVATRPRAPSPSSPLLPSEANVDPRPGRCAAGAAYLCAKTAACVLLALGVGAQSGCSPGVETTYGFSRGESINGTGAFAELLRARGHIVRSAYRLNDEVKGWADVIVRFAPSSGPPEKKEAAWYTDWLTDGEGRCAIYVARDYDAEPDYWDEVLEHLDKGADAETRGRVEDARKEARDWVEKLPRLPKEGATPEDWFAVTEPSTPPAVCETLGGPWGEDLDPGRVALPRHEALKVEWETPLLKGDGLPLAIQWHPSDDARVLVVANGSFLLNGALLNRARRPLAERVADWVGDPPRRVAFVEGGRVLGGRRGPPSVFELLRVSPFGWVAAQMLALGLAACMARAPRLGRPRPEAPSDEDRPAAHPEALGALLAKTRQAADARAILDTYRRWRYPSAAHRAPNAAVDRAPGSFPPSRPPAGPPGSPDPHATRTPVSPPESPAHE